MRSTNHLSIAAFLLTAIAVSTASLAIAGGGHSHGKASFNIALEANLIKVSGDIPLEAVAGFERVPRSDADTAKVKAAALLLRNADKLFTFSEAARCKSKQTDLNSTAMSTELLGGPAKAVTSSVNKDVHIDIDAAWIFQCEKPEALKSITVNLFDDFKGLKVIQVSVVGAKVTTGGKRQLGGRLTASSRKVTW